MNDASSSSIFDKVCLIGIGLIGSSIAHAMRARQLTRRISIYDVDPAAREIAAELGLGDEVCVVGAGAVAFDRIASRETGEETGRETGREAAPEPTPTNEPTTTRTPPHKEPHHA